MQTAGIVLVALGAWLMSVAWYDSVEGPFFRLLSGLAILVGIILFAEGIKKDIINAIRESARQGFDAANAKKTNTDS